MSNLPINNSGIKPNHSELLRGELVASFSNYKEAEAAISKLVEAEIPPRALKLVGHELKSVEQITGKLSFGKVAFRGASTGIWFGLVISLLFLLMYPEQSTTGFLLATVLICAGLSAIVSILLFQFRKGRRQFLSMSQLTAAKYDLLVLNGYGVKSREVLGQNSQSL